MSNRNDKNIAMDVRQIINCSKIENVAGSFTRQNTSTIIVRSQHVVFADFDGSVAPC